MSELKDFEVEELDEETEVTEEVQKPAKSKKKVTGAMIFKEIMSWVIPFAIAIVAALLLKNFVIINATVPTGSMENTIMPNDDLFGYRLAYLNSEPERGDIIIFKYPDDESQKFVKRIIGLPGETVEIKEAKIYVDGELLDENYLKEEWVYYNDGYVFEVPEDGYLVLGDNRNDSLDARFWTNTYVKDDAIIGKAEFIYFPFNHFGALY